MEDREVHKRLPGDFDTHMPLTRSEDPCPKNVSPFEERHLICPSCIPQRNFYSLAQVSPFIAASLLSQNLQGEEKLSVGFKAESRL